MLLSVIQVWTIPLDQSRRKGEPCGEVRDGATKHRTTLKLSVKGSRMEEDRECVAMKDKWRNMEEEQASNRNGESVTDQHITTSIENFIALLIKLLMQVS